MAASRLDDILQQAEALPPEDRLRLIARLADSVGHASTPRRRWREIRGAASHPLLGEEAQEWVSRTRREGDEHREQQWRARR